MRRFLFLAVFACSISSTAFSVVIDKFECSLTIEDKLTGTKSKQDVSLDSLRREVEVGGVWTTGVRLFRGGASMSAELTGSIGTMIATFQPVYFVAEKYDGQGRLVGRKRTTNMTQLSSLQGKFCFNGQVCERPAGVVTIPLDPFSNDEGSEREGWEDVSVGDEWWSSTFGVGRPFGDARGRYLFEINADCRSDTSVIPGSGR